MTPTPQGLLEEIERFFSTTPPEEIDRIWKEAGCDFYNKVGVNFRPPKGYHSDTEIDPEDEIRS